MTEVSIEGVMSTQLQQGWAKLVLKVNAEKKFTRIFPKKVTARKRETVSF
jgi:hypothetical protein